MIYLFSLVYFNKTSILSSKYTHDDIERHCFSRGFFLMYPLIFPAFSFSFFSLFIPPKCDTCDSKKTTLRLECAHLCAPMRAREKRSPKILPPLFPHFLFFLLLLFLFPHSPSLSLLLFCASTTRKSAFCYVCIADLSLSKEKSAHFLDFFTLWGNIDPYTNRRMRCNPPSVQKQMTCIEY